jgi:hypothetical protein
MLCSLIDLSTAIEFTDFDLIRWQEDLIVLKQTRLCDLTGFF